MKSSVFSAKLSCYNHETATWHHTVQCFNTWLVALIANSLCFIFHYTPTPLTVHTMSGLRLELRLADLATISGLSYDFLLVHI